MIRMMAQVGEVLKASQELLDVMPECICIDVHRHIHPEECTCARCQLMPEVAKLEIALEELNSMINHEKVRNGR